MKMCSQEQDTKESKKSLRRVRHHGVLIQKGIVRGHTSGNVAVGYLCTGSFSFHLRDEINVESTR